MKMKFHILYFFSFWKMKIYIVIRAKCGWKIITDDSEYGNIE